jgi:hypothetical protein
MSIGQWRGQVGLLMDGWAVLSVADPREAERALARPFSGCPFILLGSWRQHLVAEMHSPAHRRRVSDWIQANNSSCSESIDISILHR